MNLERVGQEPGSNEQIELLKQKIETCREKVEKYRLTCDIISGLLNKLEARYPSEADKAYFNAFYDKHSALSRREGMLAKFKASLAQLETGIETIGSVPDSSDSRNNLHLSNIPDSLRLMAVVVEHLEAEIGTETELAYLDLKYLSDTVKMIFPHLILGVDPTLGADPTIEEDGGPN